MDPDARKAPSVDAEGAFRASYGVPGAAQPPEGVRRMLIELMQ